MTTLGLVLQAEAAEMEETAFMHSATPASMVLFMAMAEAAVTIPVDAFITLPQTALVALVPAVHQAAQERPKASSVLSA